MSKVICQLFAAVIMALAVAAEVQREGLGADPREQVESRLAREGVRIGYDSERGSIVTVVYGVIDVKDAGGESFVNQRQALCRRLYQQGIERISEKMAMNKSTSTMTVEEGRTKNSTKNVCSTKNFYSIKVMGVTVLTSAETFDGNRYSCAFAMVWSKKQAQAAGNVLMGKQDRESPGRQCIHDWLRQQDVSQLVGVRSVVDETGLRHFVGVGTAEITGNPARDMAAAEVARLRAKEILGCALDAEVMVQMSLGGVSGHEHGKLSSKLNIGGISEIWFGEVACPVTGKKVLVSVQEINAESVKSARESNNRLHMDSVRVRALSEK